MRLLRRPGLALALLALVSLAPRLVALPGAREDNVTPDGARFLNLTREIARGHGYVTPEAFPVWLDPPRLPMPETIKEPGYPYAMAALLPLARDPFRAGQWVSLLAGALLPLAVYALARALSLDLGAALLAGLLAAASPLLIMQSVYVMADSLFALAITVMFVVGAAPGRGGRERSWSLDLAAGALAGLAFLVRGQALLALPALAWLLLARRPWRLGLARLAGALAAGIVVAAPFVVRNLRTFGAPLHSDVTVFAFWPYLEPLALTHSFQHPPEPVAWLLGHPAVVVRHTLRSAAQLVRHTLPDELLGQAIWLLPLAVGVVLSFHAWRRWGPFLLYAFLTTAFMLPLYWLARYFASVVPVLCLVTALGAMWLVRGRERLAAPARRGVSVALVVALAALVGLQAERARRRTPRTFTPEIAAARAWGPWLRERLAPGEAVMAETTSYWAWFADRPAVHLPIADDARVEALARRLRVRWAALPTSRLAEFAAAYPDRRLPRALVPVRQDRARDVTLFAVVCPSRPAE